MPKEIAYFYLLGLSVTTPMVLLFFLKGQSSLAKRGLTIIALLHVITIVLWAGELSCKIFSIALSMIGAYELSSHYFTRTWTWLIVLISGLMVGLVGFFEVPYWWVPWAAAVGLTSFASFKLISSPGWIPIFSFLIVGIGCIALFLLAEPVPVHWIALIFLVQFNDTLALLIGKRFGRYKPFPLLSPGKSIEGLIGGAFGVVIAVIAITFTLPVFFEYSMLDYLQIGFICWIVMNSGDLLFSRLKRALGLKDFSGILPGHGGTLDRFDSLLVLAPVWWLVSKGF